MSNLTGHSRITARAVEELMTERSSSPLRIWSRPTCPYMYVIQRDLFDLSGGHWTDYGQKHHFMRKFDGQSPYEAYQDAVEWIRSNALRAAQILAG